MRASWALALLVTAWAGCAGPAAPPLRVPELGPVPPLPDWPDDPPDEARVALGARLFFDQRLSGSGHSSCDGCHLHVTSFQDNLPASIPDRSYPADRPALTRNTLSFLNIVYAPVFRWDGSHSDLVDVMAFPFSEPNMDLGTDVPSAQVGLKRRLTVAVPGYVPLFQQAYGADLRALDAEAVWRLAGRALRAFSRLAVSRDAPFDRWNAGDDGAMGPDAVRGLELFRGRGRCLACHAGPFLTDFSFHNLSTSPPGREGKRADEGRYLVTGREEDRGAFLTPTLRSAYESQPYFHDGSAPGLRDVLQHLSSAAVTADPNHDAVFATPPELGASDISDLVAFLRALRGQPVGDRIVRPSPVMP